jgi:glycine hydroxymethyltransferase
LEAGRAETEGAAVSHPDRRLAGVDPEIAAAIRAEAARQHGTLEMIASENFVSPAVLEAAGSVMTNKYAEGYPGKRYYGGCEEVDKAEELARNRAKRLFAAEHANVQPHSGSQANMSAYFAFLKPGDKIMGLSLSHGGHLTHGHPVNFSGMFFKVVPYEVDRETRTLDYDALRAQALAERPQMFVAGASAYARTWDFPRLRTLCDEAGCLLMVDMAHFAGLVAAGIHPSPVPYADVVTSTTHKTMRGPRGGFVLTPQSGAEAVDRITFPGLQGGPFMHIIAAKAVCFLEAMSDEFREYQRQVVANAQRTGGTFHRAGLRRGHGRDRHAPVPARPHRAQSERQESGGGAGGGRRHRQQEHRALRHAQPLRHQRHPGGHAGPHDARDEGGGDETHRGPDGARAREPRGRRGDRRGATRHARTVRRVPPLSGAALTP